jgi:hypothetical protein
MSFQFVFFVAFITSKYFLIIYALAVLYSVSLTALQVQRQGALVVLLMVLPLFLFIVVK